MRKLFTIITLLLLACTYNLKAQDIDSDLTVYWDFDEDGTTVADKAANGEVEDNLIIADNTGISFIDGNEDFGSALSIVNSTAGSIMVDNGGNNVDLAVTDKLTFTGWINLPEGLQGVYAPLCMQMYVGGQAAKGWNIIIWGQQHKETSHGFSLNLGQGKPNNIGCKFDDPMDGSMVIPDTWFHIAWTWDVENGAKFYFNGILTAEWASADIPLSMIEYVEGQNGSIAFREANIWTIDEFRIYKRALVEEDIQAIFDLKPDAVNSSVTSMLDASKMYVNAHKENHTLKIRNAEAGQKYLVTNTLGQIISSGILTSHSVDLNTSTWKSGLYIVKVEKEIFKVQL